MKSNVFDIIIILFIVILLAFGLGLIIVQTVDDRLSNISINMPEIVVPPAKVIIEVNPELSGLNVSQLNQQSNYRIKPKIANKKFKIQKGGSIDKSPMCKPSEPRHYNSKLYHSESTKVDKPTQLFEPTDTAHEKSLPAPYPSDNINTSDIQYYKDPLEMTSTQKYKFKTKAKFSNMTIKDYSNWLQLYKDDIANLSEHNRLNLNKILKNEPLVAKDIPINENILPPTASANYEELSGILQTISPKNITDDKVLAANYDEFEQFMPPNKLKHLSHFNPDTDIKFSSPFLACMRASPSGPPKSQKK